MTPLKGLWLGTLTAPKRVRLYVWLSLGTQILIVVTGGLVRLTGSGLGCPTWPKCTDDSLTSTAEMGIHGLIEFGNRVLTIVLLVVALLTFATVFREHPSKREMTSGLVAFFGSVVLLVAGLALATRAIDLLALIVLGISAIGILGFALLFVWRANSAQRRGLVVPAFGLGFGIILQAVVGGITVLAGLNSWIVGVHFVISMVLIAIATVLVSRATLVFRGLVSPLASALSWPTVVVGAITVLVGVLVTGAGPHAGDAATPRNGLDLELWQHLHSYPGYLMLALILLQVGFQLRSNPGGWTQTSNRILVILLLASIIQAIVGVLQARMGVPEYLVAIHMFGAALLASLLTFQLLALRPKR